MTLGNLPKNLVALGAYFPLLVVNYYAEAVVRKTGAWIDWFETDSPAGPDPDGPIDGDSVEDLEDTHG